MKIAIRLTLAMALATFTATNTMAAETISNETALEMFSETCLNNAGDRAAMLAAIKQQEGIDVDVTSTSGMIATNHESGSYGFVVVNSGTATQCIIKYTPTGSVIEATTAATSALASLVDVPESAIQILGTTLLYEASVGTVMLRMGSDITFMLKNNK